MQKPSEKVQFDLFYWVFWVLWSFGEAGPK